MDHKALLDRVQEILDHKLEGLITEEDAANLIVEAVVECMKDAEGPH